MSAPRLDLPDGFTARPLTMDDGQAVYELVAAEETLDLGEPDISLEDITADWQQPSYDISASTVGIFDGDRLVAYGDLAGGEGAYAAVHPDHRGRGLGTAIARWQQALGRERGVKLLSCQVVEGGAADRLLASIGYRLRWTAWDLELPEGRELAARPLPDGFALRDATAADHEAVWTLLEDAFLEWSDRDRAPIGDFGARTWGRPGYEPWNLRLLQDASGELVGVTQVYLAGVGGYVAKIAVLADHRGRGLAPPMLVDAFALAREHGAVRCYLSTDTRAGARGLYERVGMEVASTWVNRAIDL